MPTYISLMRYTQQGIERVKQSPARLEANKKSYEAMGAKIKAFYLVLGHYDGVIIAEAPDDETAAKVAIAVAASGNARLETMRAFTEEEFRRIAAALP